MKWDTVERELHIVGSQLARLGDSFSMLAKVLRDEREVGTVNLYEGCDAPAGPEKTKKAGGPPAPSPS